MLMRLGEGRGAGSLHFCPQMQPPCVSLHLVDGAALLMASKHCVWVLRLPPARMSRMRARRCGALGLVSAFSMGLMHCVFIQHTPVCWFGTAVEWQANAFIHIHTISAFTEYSLITLGVYACGGSPRQPRGACMEGFFTAYAFT